MFDEGKTLKMGFHLEQVQSFKYFGCVVNENGIDETDNKTKVIKERIRCSNGDSVHKMSLEGIR